MGKAKWYRRFWWWIRPCVGLEDDGTEVKCWFWKLNKF